MEIKVRPITQQIAKGLLILGFPTEEGPFGPPVVEVDGEAYFVYDVAIDYGKSCATLKMKKWGVVVGT